MLSHYGRPSQFALMHCYVLRLDNLASVFVFLGQSFEVVRTALNGKCRQCLYAGIAAGVSRAFSRIFVCLSVCPRSNKKTA